MWESFWRVREEVINWKTDWLFSSRIKLSKFSFEYPIKSEFTNHSFEQFPLNSLKISDFLRAEFPNISVLSKRDSKDVMKMSETGLLLA